MAGGSSAAPTYATAARSAGSSDFTGALTSVSAVRAQAITRSALSPSVWPA